MARTPTIVLGALNIAADPHPDGIYRTLFEAASDVPVRVWGNDWAKITPPVDRGSDPPSFYGRILVWTEINREGKWLNQTEDREATPSEKKEISIPETLDPNFRSFNFVFLESRHLLVLEYKNELGDHFGAQRAETLFRKLLAKEEPQEDESVVEVTVVPSAEALDRIFALPKLRKLEIRVVRPNPDSLDEYEDRLLQKLLNQGAKEQTLILKKRAGIEKVQADDETLALATVGAKNGHVSGEGKNEDGKPVFESTKIIPKWSPLKSWAHHQLRHFSPSWAFFSSWAAQFRTIRGYWAVYGGLKALVASPYFQTSLLLGFFCLAFWSKNANMEHAVKACEIAISVLPNLLGFTVGALAIVLAFSSVDIFRLFAEGGDPKSFYLTLTANLVHFICVQVLALLSAIIARLTDWAFLDFVSLVTLFYAVIVTFAAAIQLFQTARVYNARASVPLPRSPIPRSLPPRPL